MSGEGEKEERKKAVIPQETKKISAISWYRGEQSRDEAPAGIRDLSSVCKWIEIIFYNRRKVPQSRGCG